ncbi:ABC transporter (iron.B12.siderophore.hemin), periplasmic substrate-binding component [Alloactinosynnema sp. L-07]|nr:ABC transporter (iron.B12.siderophore.hemin), periplasmic substrate-binding component [Alloactinosynnema sp. L-07]
MGLAACSPAVQEAKQDPSGQSGGSTGFPATLDDCEGRKTTFDAAPQRIVTSNGSSLELLFWLGAGDKIIGTGFPPAKGTLPESFRAAGEKVPVLGEMVISKEKLLGSGAQLYVDTFAHAGAMGGMGGPPSEEEFAAADIKHVYLKSTACAAKASGPLTDLSTVETDIKRMGSVTGTGAKADELVQGMRTKVTKVTDAVAKLPQDKRPSYFFFDFDAGTEQPIAVCGKQVANAVITLAGAKNLFADCDADFKPVGWEQVVSGNPQWIQLGVRDKGGKQENDAAFAAAEKFLREFPATAGLEAVKQGKFVRVSSEATTIAGVRNADAVVEIAKTIHPDVIVAQG